MNEDIQLSQFSNETEVMELLFNALMQTGYGNDYIYDDINGRYMLVTDVESVIAQMKAADEVEA